MTDLAYNNILIDMRRKCGVTQTAAAAYLGVDQSTISRMESGGQAMSVDVLVQLCELYGGFVTITQTPKPAPPKVYGGAFVNMRPRPL